MRYLFFESKNSRLTLKTQKRRLRYDLLNIPRNMAFITNKMTYFRLFATVSLNNTQVNHLPIFYTIIKKYRCSCGTSFM